MTIFSPADPPWLANLDLAAAAERHDLLAEPVAAAIPRDVAVLAAPIDPELADTATFCGHYGIPASASANCVIVKGKRSGETRYAAVVVLATTRADINNAVRRHLDVRKISFAPMAEATSLTGMEYGGITPIGLPGGWPILVDQAVTRAGPVVIGSGIRGSKIVVAGAEIAGLPEAETLPGLAKPADDAG